MASRQHGITTARRQLEELAEHNGDTARAAYQFLARLLPHTSPSEVVAVRFEGDTERYLLRFEEDGITLFGFGKVAMTREVRFPFMFGAVWDTLPTKDDGSCTLALIVDSAGRFKESGFVVHYGPNFCEVFRCRLVTL